MPRVRFTQDYDFRMTPHCVRAYKAGMKCLVSQDCADKAVAAGKAELVVHNMVEQESDAGF